MIAAVHVTGTSLIRVHSEGYKLFEINADELEKVPEEENTTKALIRGVVNAFTQLGAKVSGFDVAITSSVLRGSGISSSAAFEVLFGNIVNHLFFRDQADAVKIARIGQYAENVYFGKPSGLMDQMASSVGNLLTIDFEDPANPVVTKLDVDFDQTKLALCIIDSGADHADLTDEYAAVPGEIKKICSLLGKDVSAEYCPCGL